MYAKEFILIDEQILLGTKYLPWREDILKEHKQKS
jgi:hypothetical protein